jgi:hypothetical protein
VACLLPGNALAQGHEPPTAPSHELTLEDRVRILEEALMQERATSDERVREIEAERDAHGERVRELEDEKVVREDATRAIISESLTRLGSRINEAVDFSGVIEVLPGWSEDFQGGDEGFIQLETLQLQFDVQTGTWARGRVVIEYDDGGDIVFTTTEDDELSIDRINVDQAFITLGDTERWWPFGTFGRIVVPFGISTGDPVADVLNIVDPLTVEVFETRKNALLVGLEFPTPRPMPEAVAPAPERVKPFVVAPAIGGLARLFGYKAPPPPPPPVRFVALRPDPAPFNLGVYFYQGDTFEDVDDANEWNFGDHWGATAGYRTRGKCRSSYVSPSAQPAVSAADDLPWWHMFCPWTLDFDVDYNSSIFDSDFLSLQYRNMLGPIDDPGDIRFGLNSIGFVPGMAASLKTSLGPVGLVAEWNGALETTNFQQDDGQPISIKPSAWQVSLAYQFGWKPWVEEIGAQGTYVTISYSESNDLVGVQRINQNDFTPFRVGAVPEKRLAVGAGEWILPGVRIAVEYVRSWDYPEARGIFAGIPMPPTETTANSFLSVITFEW